MTQDDGKPPPLPPAEEAWHKVLSWQVRTARAEANMALKLSKFVNDARSEFGQLQGALLSVHGSLDRIEKRLNETVSVEIPKRLHENPKVALVVGAVSGILFNLLHLWFSGGQ